MNSADTIANVLTSANTALYGVKPLTANTAMKHYVKVSYLDADGIKRGCTAHFEIHDNGNFEPQLCLSDDGRVLGEHSLPRDFWQDLECIYRSRLADAEGAPC